jgi:predicted acyl esterase
MKFVALLVCACAGSLAAVAADADYPWRQTGFIPVAVGTPQETLLQYQVMFPDPAAWGGGPYPVVLDYSGYEPATTIFDGLDERFLAAGYAVAGVNMRGSHGSGGTFDYFEPLQGQDGADSVEWLAAQPWSTGRVAMAGKSWPGISQLYVAAARPQGLVAIAPGHVFGDLYRDVAYPGGIMNATFCSYWSLARNYEGYVSGLIQYSETQNQQVLVNQLGHLPNVLFNPLVKMLVNQFDQSMYHERSSWYFADQIQVPTFLVQAWQDEQVGGRAVDLVSRFNPGRPWRPLGTNGDHGEYYGPEVFPHILRFFSYYVKQEIPAGEQQMVLAPLILPNGKAHPTKKVWRLETFQDALARYQAEDRVVINFENGAHGDRNGNWSKTYASWPPPNQTPWKLNLFNDLTLRDQAYPQPGLGGLLGTVTPRSLGAVDYLYLPGVGVQARGGYGIDAPLVDVNAVPPGTWNDRPPAGTFAEFTSPALQSDKVLAGNASVDLYIASTALDTDFEVTLSEIRPDGQETFVQQGWLRASRRKLDPALTTPLRPYQTHQVLDVQALVPGLPTKVRIEIFPFAHTFRAGSRIRVAVTAPHLHPDLWGFAALPLPAMNTIFTSAQYPSSIVLPLLQGETAGAPLPPVGSLRNLPSRPAQATPAPTLVTPLLLPLPSAAYRDSWLAEVEELGSVAQGIVSEDVPLDLVDLSAWYDLWAAIADLPLGDVPAPGDVPAAVLPEWQAFVDQVQPSPAQSDAYFISLFDTWFAAQQ